jgi:urease accessory protein
VFFVHAHRSLADPDDRALRTVAELAVAFAPSKERHLETTAQGAAFIEATHAAWPCPALDRLAAAWTGPLAYPVAVGVAAAGHGIALPPALRAVLHAVTANSRPACAYSARAERWPARARRARTGGRGDRTAALISRSTISAARRFAPIGSQLHETHTRLFRS